MTQTTKTPQIVDLFGKVRKCLERNKYSLTRHAFDRGIEREIDLQDALHVLKTGNHERRKTSFDSVHNTWKHAIRGRTLDHVELRVIIAFDLDDMIIITVMEIV